MTVIRRSAAVGIGLILFVMFWGGFLIAEHDAYGSGHAGYIHSPWGILCYAAAVILSLPAFIVMKRLWRIRTTKRA